MDADKIFPVCLGFFNGIGLKWTYVDDIPSPVVPGFGIEDGVLQICQARVEHPGDILHEAAHLAVVPAADRSQLSNSGIGDRPNANAEEMMAIAWSYAAAIHLGIDPKIIFHESGYKGGGNWLANVFESGGDVGVPLLIWAGMTKDFPKMKQWLRD